MVKAMITKNRDLPVEGPCLSFKNILACGPAAIHQKYIAVYITGVVAGQEKCCRGNLLGRTRSRCGSHYIFDTAVAVHVWNTHGIADFSGNSSGGNGIAANTVWHIGSSYGKYHHTNLLLPAVILLGVNFPFFTGCHSCASSGYSVLRSLYLGHTFCPIKYGHPSFKTGKLCVRAPKVIGAVDAYIGFRLYFFMGMQQRK